MVHVFVKVAPGAKMVLSGMVSLIKAAASHALLVVPPVLIGAVVATAGKVGMGVLVAGKGVSVMVGVKDGVAVGFAKAV
jgi:hypothetical protein